MAGNDDFLDGMASGKAKADQFSALLRSNEELQEAVLALVEHAFVVASEMRAMDAERTNVQGYLLGVLLAAVDKAFGIE